MYLIYKKNLVGITYYIPTIDPAAMLFRGGDVVYLGRYSVGHMQREWCSIIGTYLYTLYY